MLQPLSKPQCSAYFSHRSRALQSLSWLPRMLRTKISPPLSCSLELASSTFCILLPNASFLLLLLQRYVCTLQSQKSDWLVEISR